MNDANPIETVMSRVLAPAGLDEADLRRALATISTRDVDAADLYFQVSRQESWAVEDGIVKEGSFHVDRGVGVRAVSGEKTGFAYSDELIVPALERAASAARAISRQGEAKSVAVPAPLVVPELYPPIDPTLSAPDERKTALLAELDRATRALDPRITQVMLSLVSSQDLVLIVAADGTLTADVRPLVRL